MSFVIENGILKKYYEDNSTHVVIPDNVTSIGNSAFSNCTNITSVIIPESVTSIGNYAFMNCNKLKTIEIPKSITYIGSFAFHKTQWFKDYRNRPIILGDHILYAYNGNAKKYNISEDVKYICRTAFEFSNSISSISIPASVISIAEGTLDSLSSLTSIQVSDNNKYYCDEDGVLFNKDKTKLIKYPCAKSNKKYVIPPKTISITQGAFSKCLFLENVTLPEGITTVKQGWFDNCSMLSTITLPKSTTSIEDYAFSACPDLKSISIPNGVTTIGNGAFKSCISLKRITLPRSLKDLGKEVFMDCVNLSTVRLPPNITYIRYKTFFNCENLKELILPKNVLYVSDEAFVFCRKLNLITIYNKKVKHTFSISKELNQDNLLELKSEFNKESGASNDSDDLLTRIYELNKIVNSQAKTINRLKAEISQLKTSQEKEH